MDFIIADSSLSPGEKEEKQVERLIHKRPAPSRKHTEKRGPAHDQRRERMTVTDDPDVGGADKDLSLNYKQTGSMVADVALNLVLSTSNEVVVNRYMTTKTSTYHGVIQQGHPDGPYPGYKSYDKRYFGKDEYKSILSTANDLLDEDWLKYGWDGGSDDAKYRAALDLAIHLADSNLYQGKIDTETYNMLLNRLAKWKQDSFSETVFLPTPTGVDRRAAVMKTHYQNIVRVANDLRKTDPRRALEIMKNLRALVAQEECGPMMEAPANPPVGVSQQQEQAQITPSDTDAFVEGKLDMGDLKMKTDKLVSAQDMDDFLAGLKDLSDLVKKNKSHKMVASDDSTAGSPNRHRTKARFIAGHDGDFNMEELAPLHDMSDEESAAFLAAQKQKMQELEKFAQSGEIDLFMAGFDDILNGAEEAAQKVKTGSVNVNLATLVKLAMMVPAAGRVLLPILLAAKKKKDKKKPAKTSQKDKKEEKGNPFAKKDKADGKPGKKGKPFGGKQAPPFGKKSKKASVELSDSEW